MSFLCSFFTTFIDANYFIFVQSSTTLIHHVRHSRPEADISKGRECCRPSYYPKFSDLVSNVPISHDLSPVDNRTVRIDRIPWIDPLVQLHWYDWLRFRLIWLFAIRTLRAPTGGGGAAADLALRTGACAAGSLDGSSRGYHATSRSPQATRSLVRAPASCSFRSPYAPLRSAAPEH